MSSVRWMLVDDLSQPRRIRELQDRNGEECDDDEVVHTDAGNMALVLDWGDDQMVLEGTPGALYQFVRQLVILVDEEVGEQEAEAVARGWEG